VKDAAGQVAEARIEVVFDAPPSARIDDLTPDLPITGDLITLTGIVSDVETDARELKATWQDQRGRVLEVSTPDRDGIVTLVTDTLDAGDRQITLLVVDALGQEESDTLRFTITSCSDDDHDGWTDCDGDCDDADDTSFPGALEVCDGADQDCNGIDDNGFPDVDNDKIMDCIDVDPYEPNDSIESPTFLLEVNGSSALVTTIVEATLHPEDGSDFYKFYLQDDFAIGDDPFYLEILLNELPDNADFDLYLWWDDPADFYFTGIQVVGSSTGTGSQDEHIYHDGSSGPDDGGNYGIEVRPTSGTGCQSTYTLRFSNLG